MSSKLYFCYYLQNVTGPTIQQRLSCLWCASEAEGRRCKQFRATSVIPLQGVPCPEFKYNVGTCTSKLMSAAYLSMIPEVCRSTLLVRQATHVSEATILCASFIYANYVSWMPVA